MRRFSLGLALLMVSSSVSLGLADDDQHHNNRAIRVHLSGYNEVHFVAGPPVALRGAVSTAGSGMFAAKFDKRREVIHYELSYGGLEGTVTQAHIHFGQRHTVGGIVVWLCQTAGTPAPTTVADLTPSCPVPGGTVTGTITPAQVLAQTTQGVEAGAFDELVDAMQAGATYVNVHSSLFGPGEIRGQIPGRHWD